MILKIKKMHPDAIIPSFQYDTDAGMDLYAIEDGFIGGGLGSRQLVHTGLAIALPQGYEAQIRPRSGLALKHGVTVLNSPGTIDEQYRGEIGVIFINHGSDTFYFKKGDRIAQMVIKKTETRNIEVIEVEDLDDTDRGSGGFGSTGK